MNFVEAAFDGEAYHTPYIAVEYPEIDAGYLPPNVSVHFAFGPHGTERHFAPIAQLLEKADIYVPEHADYSASEAEVYRRIVKANPNDFAKIISKNRIEDPFVLAQMTALRRTYKQIVHADSQPGEIDVSGYDTEATISAPTLDEALLAFYGFRYWLVREAIDKRDAIILGKLGPRLHEALRVNPKLERQENVEVLVALGTNHQRIFERLTDLPHTADQVSASVFDRYELRSEIHGQVSSLIKANQPVPRKLLTKDMVANLLPIMQMRDPAQAARIRNKLLELLFTNLDQGSAELVRRYGTSRASVADKQRFEQFVNQAVLLSAEQ